MAPAVVADHNTSITTNNTNNDDVPSVTSEALIKHKEALRNEQQREMDFLKAECAATNNTTDSNPRDGKSLLSFEFGESKPEAEDALRAALHADVNGDRKEGAPMTEAELAEKRAAALEDARLRQAQEATILERAEEIQAEAEARRKLLAAEVPQVRRCRTQWDYVLEEMAWLANDFAQERLWKTSAAAHIANLAARCDGAAGLQRRKSKMAEPDHAQVSEKKQTKDTQTAAKPGKEEVKDDGTAPPASDGQDPGNSNAIVEEIEDWWLEGTASPISPLCFTVEMEEVMKILNLVEEDHNAIVRKAESQLREVEEAMRRSMMEPTPKEKTAFDGDGAWEPTAEDLAQLDAKGKRKRPKKVSAKAASGLDSKVEGEDGALQKPMSAAEAKRLRIQQKQEAAAAAKAAKKAAALAAKAALAESAADGSRVKKKKMAETLAEAMATGLPRRSHKAGGGEVNRKNQQAYAERQAQAAAAAAAAAAGHPGVDPSGSPNVEGGKAKKSQRNRAAEKARRQAKQAAAAAGLSVPMSVPAPWSASEDKVLCAIVHEFGSNWGLVSDVIYANRAVKGVYRPPLHCKARWRQLMGATSSGANDANTAPGSAKPEESGPMALNMNKNVARMVLQRSMPVEDDILKLHMEKIVMAVGKQKHKKNEKRQSPNDLNAFHPSHQAAMQNLSQQAASRLTNPLQICDSLAQPVPALGPSISPASGGAVLPHMTHEPKAYGGAQQQNRVGAGGGQQPQIVGMRQGAAADEAQRLRQVANAGTPRATQQGPRRGPNALALAFAAVQAANSGRLGQSQMAQVLATLKQQRAQGSVECHAALTAIATNTPLQQHLPPHLQQQLQQLQAAKAKQKAAAQQQAAQGASQHGAPAASHSKGQKRPSSASGPSSGGAQMGPSYQPPAKKAKSASKSKASTTPTPGVLPTPGVGNYRIGGVPAPVQPRGAGTTKGRASNSPARKTAATSAGHAYNPAQRGTTPFGAGPMTGIPKGKQPIGTMGAQYMNAQMKAGAKPMGADNKAATPKRATKPPSKP